RTRAIVIQQKTGRPVQFALLESARGSILAWLERRGGTLDEFVFSSRVDHADHINTRQYARLVDEWVTGVGLRREDYGTHSLRRTKASIIYKQTGNLRAVQILLGHTKIESTVRYLGVDIEDALALVEGTEVEHLRSPSASLLRSFEPGSTWPGCAHLGHPAHAASSPKAVIRGG